jgi:isopentenyldiphosphate isomerase
MKIPIVNDRDEIIAYKEREDRNPEEIIRVTAIWITDESGNILLQQRGLDKKHNPGKWGPAASGTVEEGESYDQNAVKELEEELGLKGITLVKSKKCYAETNTGKRFAQIYTATIPRNSEFILESEVAGVWWVTKAELQELLLEKPDDFVSLMQDLLDL